MLSDHCQPARGPLPHPSWPEVRLLRFPIMLNYLSEINSLGSCTEPCSKIIKGPSYLSAVCLQMKKNAYFDYFKKMSKKCQMCHHCIT